MLTEAQKKRLLEIARGSIGNFIIRREKAEFNETDAELIKEKGAFVTIKKDGDLRGCIGHIVADAPLYQTVADMAVEAAFSDPRFPPLLPEELERIEIEISVLSELKRIENVSKIEVGKHGILIRKDFSSGLLLPQVATEYGWSREEFLEHTCLKAGLPKDAWREGADIYIFSAEVFGE